MGTAAESSDPMAVGNNRQPNGYSVNVTIPWELLEDLKRAQFRYGATNHELKASVVRQILLDALCRELQESGYYGSGAKMWYGSPMQTTRR